MGQTSSSPNGRYRTVTIWNPATGRGWITPDRGGNNIPVCAEYVRPGQSLCLGKGVMYVMDPHGRAIEVGDRTGWVMPRVARSHHHGGFHGGFHDGGAASAGAIAGASAGGGGGCGGGGGGGGC